jgi:uncharacterized protein (DUF885 family)
MPQTPDRAVRDLADSYVTSLADLNPTVAIMLGLESGAQGVPDLSPAGYQADDELSRATLVKLSRLTSDAPPAADVERRCARLLRERLETALAVSATGENLRAVRNILGPVQGVRTMFMMLPTASEADWSAVAKRMALVPQALAGYAASLREGAARGLLAPARQVGAFTSQLQDWSAAGEGRGWFAQFCDAAQVPPSLRAELDKAALAANAAVDELSRWMLDDYAPAAESVPDGIGAELYPVLARSWLGAGLDLADTYMWGWSEYHRIMAEMREQAERVLPGATVAEAMRHLDEHGEAVEGVEEIRQRLQEMLDRRVADLDGAHFDLAGPVRTVEARIAPPGSAAAPYYTRPSHDFSRPGRTWLPTLGQTRFPLWKLVTTWHHEGVPGHHLQLGTWTTLAGELSTYQTGVGAVSAMLEGWALYAERLMDELGYLSDPGARLGYLEAQLRRAIRVIVDIGMHLRMELPAGVLPAAENGRTWTPELAIEFFSAHTARSVEFVSSEIVRYLGRPGQAIGYKVGERAWLAGREAARAARAGRGEAFDLKSWHMSALGLGALGLDDLTTELALL